MVQFDDTPRRGRGALAKGEFQCVRANVFTGSQRVSFSSEMSMHNHRALRSHSRRGECPDRA